MKTAALLRVFVATLAVVLGSAPAPKAEGQTPLDEHLKEIVFEQKLGQRVSLDLPFRDEEGRSVTLATYFRDRPVILVPGYYQCPMLCRAMANGLVNALRDIAWMPGKDFTVLHFSVDPRETPELAAQKKRSYLAAYSREGSRNGWHFLTGTDQSARTLADEIGFHYFYDPESKQYAHPSGVVVLTPGGRISRYAFGVNFTASDLQRSLIEARGETIGGRLRQLILLCFHYQPVTGRYAAGALLGLRMASVTLLASLGAWIVCAVRSEKAKAANESR